MQNAHPCHPGDVRDDVVELQVHLHQCLLHVLDVGSSVLGHPCAVPEVRLQRPDLVPRPEAATEQPVLVQSLDPLRVAHVGLASRNALHRPRVDEQHLKAARFEDLVDGDPVHARGLHGDRRDPERLEPIGKAVEISGEGVETPDGLWVPIRRDGDGVEA